MTKPSKAVTHSIRMDREVYDVLHKEATTKSASFNNLVNQILKKYAEFDRFIPDFKFMLFHKGLIVNGMQTLPDDNLQSLGEEEGALFAKDALLTMGLPLNKDSLEYFIHTVVAQYTNFFDCQISDSGDGETFYLRHDLGPKWSIFLTGFISGAFKSVLKQKVEIERSNDAIRFVVA